MKIWEMFIYRSHGRSYKVGEFRYKGENPEVLAFQLLKRKHGFYLKLKR